MKPDDVHIHYEQTENCCGFDIYLTSGVPMTLKEVIGALKLTIAKLAKDAEDEEKELKKAKH